MLGVKSTMTLNFADHQQAFGMGLGDMDDMNPQPNHVGAAGAGRGGSESRLRNNGQ
ncbi:unnamed protein product, partial [Laminaria digitata]